MHSDVLPTLRLFLKIFLPSYLLVSIISWLSYQSEVTDHLDALKQRQLYGLQTQTHPLKQEIISIVSDLKFISALDQLGQVVNRSTKADVGVLSSEFLAFCEAKKIYDQVRYLDESGMEIVRVNFNRDQPYIVPKEQLQSKKGRYYFEDTFRLSRGEVFVSPFDLNIEGGALELPLKPMIRFGTPVFDRNGKKRGVVVLNYLGQNFIDYFEKTSVTASVQTFNLLVNSDGYFLKGMKNDDDWGFMLTERKDKSFAHFFPEEWSEIAAGESGQFVDGRGLFTYTSYFPLLEGLRTSSGSRQALGSSAMQLDAYQYRWKVISFTPLEVILELTENLGKLLLLVNLCFLLLGGTGIWIYARAVLRQRNAEIRIEHMAHFDHLTGLPNRPLLYDRLGKLMASAQRAHSMFATLFIDLDGFKEINDRHGHEAGDAVLKHVAQRLQHCLRETDTAARLGGDEFIVLLASIQNEQDASMIAAKILRALTEPIAINKTMTATIGACIGLAIYPKDGDTQDALISNADRAMYIAKQAGKNSFHAHSV